MYAHAFARVGIVFAILLGIVGRPAADEVVSIKGGTFVFERGQSGLLDIFGTQGFQMQAAALDGRFNAVSQCQVPECPPGAEVEIDASWGGLDLPGTAVLRGKTYGDLGGVESPNGAVIGFSGTITMPPASAGPVSVVVPFQFAAMFFYGDPDGTSSNRALLVGGGDATFQLEPDPSAETFSWMITSVVFEFRKD
jgi:hypothetical protein